MQNKLKQSWNKTKKIYFIYTMSVHECYLKY